MNPIIEYENLGRTNSLFFEEYKREFDDFLKSGWFILGRGVAKFEQQYAHYCGSPFCIGVGSGLDALILAIDALALPKDSEIIVPSNTYIATILAIVKNGLKPVLVEPDISTYNIDPNKIEENISINTRAILVVHLYGKACNMGPIESIAKRFNLIIIEDAAQAQGAKYLNKHVGSFGIGCHSFYPTKNLGSLGDAGAITASDEVYISKLKMLRNYGSAVKYKNDVLGYNSRLDEVQARFLSIKLKHLDQINAHKRKLARVYLDTLSDEFFKPSEHHDFFDVYHIFNIRHPKRDQIRDFLLTQGIQTEIHYPIPPHRQVAMKEVISGNYPISDEIHETTLSLPIALFHTENDMLRVAETLNDWLKM